MEATGNSWRQIEGNQFDGGDGATYGCDGDIYGGDDDFYGGDDDFYGGDDDFYGGDGAIRDGDADTYGGGVQCGCSTAPRSAGSAFLSLSCLRLRLTATGILYRGGMHSPDKLGACEKKRETYGACAVRYWPTRLLRAVRYERSRMAYALATRSPVLTMAMLMQDSVDWFPSLYALFFEKGHWSAVKGHWTPVSTDLEKKAGMELSEELRTVLEPVFTERVGANSIVLCLCYEMSGLNDLGDVSTHVLGHAQHTD
eukprot:2637520-Rhodomonas_salina.3